MYTFVPIGIRMYANPQIEECNCTNILVNNPKQTLVDAHSNACGCARHEHYNTFTNESYNTLP